MAGNHSMEYSEGSRRGQKVLEISNVMKLRKKMGNDGINGNFSIPSITID